MQMGYSDVSTHAHETIPQKELLEFESPCTGSVPVSIGTIQRKHIYPFLSAPSNRSDQTLCTPLDQIVPYGDWFQV